MPLLVNQTSPSKFIFFFFLFSLSLSVISFFYQDGWVNGVYSKTDSFPAPVIINVLSTDEGSMSDEVSSADRIKFRAGVKKIGI